MERRFVGLDERDDLVGSGQSQVSVISRSFQDIVNSPQSTDFSP